MYAPRINTASEKRADTRPACRTRQCRTRRGLTLAELLVASLIMALIAGALGAVSLGVQTGHDYATGRGAALQHARVAVERIQRTIRGSIANEHFPGFMAISEVVDGWTFPDTLVIWSPETAASDPRGLPLFSELVIYCPDPSNPTRLLELRAPSEIRPVPAVTAMDEWRNELSNLKALYAQNAVEITTLLRTARVNSSGTSGSIRGCVRFHVSMYPSAAEWTEYRAGTRNWNALSWPLSSFGSETGIRKILGKIELQLRPGQIGSNDSTLAVPFYAPLVTHYALHRT